MKTLMAMGGALRRNQPVVLREFTRRAGGQQARIAILPQASALEDTGAYKKSSLISTFVSATGSDGCCTPSARAPVCWAWAWTRIPPPSWRQMPGSRLSVRAA